VINEGHLYCQKNCFLLFPRKYDPILTRFTGIGGSADSRHTKLDNQVKDDDGDWQGNVLEKNRMNISLQIQLHNRCLKVMSKSDV